MKFYELIKDTLGMKSGQSFMQTSDGSYSNTTNTCKLNSTMVENNPEFFKEVEAPKIWKPETEGEAFWTVTPDGGSIELAWNEERFSRLWQFGNLFRDKEHADEVVQAIAVMIPTYQKKFTAYIEKHPKDRKILQQTNQQATPPVTNTPTMPIQQPTPPVTPPVTPPPVINRNIVTDPQFSPFNRFTTPGNER